MIFFFLLFQLIPFIGNGFFFNEFSNLQFLLFLLLLVPPHLPLKSSTVSLVARVKGCVRSSCLWVLPTFSLKSSTAVSPAAVRVKGHVRSSCLWGLGTELVPIMPLLWEVHSRSGLWLPKTHSLSCAVTCSSARWTPTLFPTTLWVWAEERPSWWKDVPYVGE